MIQIGFGGTVGPCKCSCHRGMFRVFVHAVVTGEAQDLGGVNFETEQMAVDNLQNVVKDFAARFLDEIGLTPELANKVSVTHGDEAVAAEQRVRNHNNTHLH